MNAAQDIDFHRWVDARTQALCHSIRALNKLIKKLRHYGDFKAYTHAIDVKLKLCANLQMHLDTFGVDTYGYP